jgi:hypothetical protein
LRFKPVVVIDHEPATIPFEKKIDQEAFAGRQIVDQQWHDEVIARLLKLDPIDPKTIEAFVEPSVAEFLTRKAEDLTRQLGVPPVK